MYEFQSLPEKLLLKGGTVIDPSQNLEKRTDILIEDGKITAVEEINESHFSGVVMDVDGKIVSPGWMDLHVHLREPGREDEETIESGTLAAANGGFTAVCCMPNTNPPIDSQEIIQYIKDRARDSLVEVYPIATITKKRAGDELAEILDLVEQGAVAISDDGSPVMSAEIMRRALEYSKMVNIPVIGHEEDITMTADGHIHEGFVSTCLGLGGIPSVAEDIMIARDIMLAEYTGGRFHVAHISTRKSVELVREAKKRGVQVTAEVTPHHFTLTDEAVRGYDTNAKMKPPLRTADDIEAIMEGLQDNTIDAIATDHAPHSWEEKASEFIYAPFGIVGLETALGLSMTKLVHSKKLSLSQLIEKFSTNPYRILGLEPPSIQKGMNANITVFDPEITWTFDEKQSLSRSHNSPFIGWKLTGKPHLVINRGKLFSSILAS
ncbi:MAG: dihydroorotase [Calditrichaeota bacterium]|nr:MAG: dihydroorotase [Calditrichota bacterium]